MGLASGLSHGCDQVQSQLGRLSTVWLLQAANLENAQAQSLKLHKHLLKEQVVDWEGPSGNAQESRRETREEANFIKEGQSSNLNYKYNKWWL